MLLLLLPHAGDKKGDLLLLRLPKPRGYCRRMLRRASSFLVILVGSRGLGAVQRCQHSCRKDFAVLCCSLAEVKPCWFDFLVVGKVLGKYVHC